MNWKWPSAHALAYAGGLLLLVGGGSGSASDALLVVAAADGVTPRTVEPVLAALEALLIFAATFGGTAVLIGGYVAEKRGHPWAATLLIMLGAGLGLLGFFLRLAERATDPVSLVAYVAGFLTGLVGLGTLLALLAQVRLVAQGIASVRRGAEATP